MTEGMSLSFALLTVTANVAFLTLLLLFLLARISPSFDDMFGRLRSYLGDQALGLAWIVAVVATLGSLYLSEVADFTPCKLCWFQRIAMYPQAVILGIATLRRDLNVRIYVVPVVLIGAALSIYHYLLQRFPDIGGASCDPTAPCTTTWIWRFHYVSIPFMALSAFALIAALLLAARAEATERVDVSKEVRELERSLA